jgi:hypothetical protein
MKCTENMKYRYTRKNPYLVSGHSKIDNNERKIEPAHGTH